jgi:hypothetical protein
MLHVTHLLRFSTLHNSLPLLALTFAIFRSIRFDLYRLREAQQRNALQDDLVSESRTWLRVITQAMSPQPDCVSALKAVKSRLKRANAAFQLLPNRVARSAHLLVLNCTRVEENAKESATADLFLRI